jgi:hypothetical protein
VELLPSDGFGQGGVLFLTTYFSNPGYFSKFIYPTLSKRFSIGGNLQQSGTGFFHKL